MSKSNAVKRKRTTASGDKWRSSGKILFVDDEETIRQVGNSLLKLLGFEALLAADGLEAIRTFKEHAADLRLVLLDMSMPRMDDYEVFRELRKIRADIIAIICSSHNITDDVDRPDCKDIAGFIQKPYQLSTLSRKIREVLGE